jgi:uncharacterized membrane protein YfcA
VAEFVSLAPHDLLLLIVAALVAGMVDAIAGGGGLIALPALLAAGLPPHLALGTNKLAGTFGTLSASRAYVRKGLFKPRLWRTAAAATFLGAVAGTMAVWLVAAAFLAKLIPVLVVAVAIYVLLHGKPMLPSDAAEPRPGRHSSALVGLSLGFYDGFAGPGAGAFWTTAGLWLFKLDLVRASGVARFMNLVSNAVSLATFSLLGLVDWSIGLAMGVSLMVGAHIGAHSAIRFGARFIRPVFVTIVLALAAKLIWQEWLR